MSTSTVALTIEMPSLDASLSWNALESLVVGMSHEVPARALALALDDAQERLLQEACGPRWAPVRGLLAPFACPGCGAREDFARKGKRTRPRKLHTAAGTVELILWHVGCRGCGRNFAPLLVILGLSGKRRTDRLSLDLAELGTQMSFARAGRVDAELAGPPPRRGRHTTPWPTWPRRWPVATSPSPTTTSPPPTGPTSPTSPTPTGPRTTSPRTTSPPSPTPPTSPATASQVVTSPVVTSPVRQRRAGADPLRASRSRPSPVRVNGSSAGSWECRCSGLGTCPRRSSCSTAPGAGPETRPTGFP